jgi:hypothetical protein
MYFPWIYRNSAGWTYVCNSSFFNRRSAVAAVDLKKPKRLEIKTKNTKKKLFISVCES